MPQGIYTRMRGGVHLSIALLVATSPSQVKKPTIPDNLITKNYELHESNALFIRWLTIHESGVRNDILLLGGVKIPTFRGINGVSKILDK